jgi:prolipoprotein diacylglyceryl transferase
MMLHLPASIPSPPSGTLELGPLTIHAYGLVIALGVVAGIWLIGRRLEARGAGTRDDAAAIGMWGVLGGVIGARLYHVATSWDSFSDDPLRMFAIWKGGLGIPGGIALGVAVGVYAAKRRGLDVPVAITCAAPALPLAQAIGRWGNWFNQELFGGPTTLPWALEVSDETAMKAGYPPGTTFHPTFLYESLWNLALCGLLLWIDRRFRLRPGNLMAVYLIGYGIGRFWIEGMRIDPASEVAGLRWNQWVALAMIVIGVVVLVVRRGSGDEPAAPADPDATADAAPDAAADAHPDAGMDEASDYVPQDE